MESSLGQKLKKARETKGLSLEEIAKVTKISEKSLILIENGQFHELPAPTYIRGFIKLYAQCVGLDAHSVLEEFQKGQVPEAKQVLVLEGEKIESPGIWQIIGSSLKASLLVVWAFVLKYLKIAFSYLKRVPPKIWAGAGGGLVFVLLLIQFFRPEAPKTEPVPSSIEKPVIVNQNSSPGSSLIRPEATSGDQIPIKQASEPIRSSVSTPVSPSSSSSASSLSLEGEVNQPVWLRIYSDQRLVFEGTLKKGARETWKAQDSFRLRVGNPDAIQFSLNGKPLGRMGPPGKIRDIRLTKDGWYVSDE